MAENAQLKPFKRVLFKPVQGVPSGGCHVDVHVPKSASQSSGGSHVAMFIHGGGFSWGASSDAPTAQVSYLLDQGYVVLSAEYRLAPHARIADEVDDMVDAIAWIRSDLGKTVNVPVNVNSITCLGYSAGGPLALMLEAELQKRKLPSVQALVLVYGLYIFEGLCGEKLDEETLEKEDELTQKLISDEPMSTGIPFGKGEESALRNEWMESIFTKNTFMRYIGSPVNGKTINPIDLITSSFPPTACVLATEDEEVNPEDTRKLHAALGKIGVKTEIFVADGGTHDYNIGKGKVWDEAFLPALKWAVKNVQ